MGIHSGFDLVLIPSWDSTCPVLILLLVLFP